MISIIIPMYNVGEFIKSTLESLENQSDQNFEVIIINDGSTDNSLQMVKEYMMNTKLIIKIINQENSGVSVSRNKGIEVSEGEFCCFIDADDVIQENYIEVMKAALLKENLDIVFCAMKEVPEDFSLSKCEEITFENQYKIYNRNDGLKAFLYGEFKSGACSLMIKKEILTLNNISFKNGFKYSEDLHFVWRALDNSSKVGVIKDELYMYRTRHNSAMSKLDDNRFDGLKLMYDLEDYFNEKNSEFYPLFKKFGVARWIWATLWQSCISSDNYIEFKNYTKKVDVKSSFKNLTHYPNLKVKLSSIIFLASPKLYYYTVSALLKKKIQRKINLEL